MLKETHQGSNKRGPNCIPNLHVHKVDLATKNQRSTMDPWEEPKQKMSVPPTRTNFEIRQNALTLSIRWCLKQTYTSSSWWDYCTRGTHHNSGKRWPEMLYSGNLSLPEWLEPTMQLLQPGFLQSNKIRLFYFFRNHWFEQNPGSYDLKPLPSKLNQQLWGMPQSLSITRTTRILTLPHFVSNTNQTQCKNID
jgi:hypothetical protein